MKIELKENGLVHSFVHTETDFSDLCNSDLSSEFNLDFDDESENEEN